MLKPLTFRLTCVSTLYFLTVACGGTVVNEITGPDVVRCQTSVSGPQSSVPSAGAQLSLAVAAARECSWNASSDASWVRVTPSSGQGEASLTLTVDENNAGVTRAATLALNDARVTVTQEAAPCRFTLDRESTVVSHTGGSASVRLSTLDGCEWSSSVNANWVRVVNSAGRGSATVLFEFEPNDGNERSATAQIAGLPFAIVQQVAPPPPPPPAPPPPSPPPPPPASPPPAPPPATPPPATPPPATPPPATPPPATPPPATPPPATPPPATPPPAPPPPRPPAPPPPPPAPPAEREWDGEGEVSNLSGRCPEISFRLRGVTVNADRDTRFRGGMCPSIRNGRDVEVEGVLLPNGSVRATSIRIGR